MIDTQVRKEKLIPSIYERSPGITTKDRPHGGLSPEKLGVTGINDLKNLNKQNIYGLYSTIKQEDDEDGQHHILKGGESVKHLDDQQFDEDDIHFFDIVGGTIPEERDRQLEATLGRESEETTHTKPRLLGQTRDDPDDQRDYDTFIVNPSDQYNSSTKGRESPTKLTKIDQLTDYQTGFSQSASAKKKNQKKEETLNLKEELGGNGLRKAENIHIEPGTTHTEGYDEDVGEVKGLIDLQRDHSVEPQLNLQTDRVLNEIYEIHDEQENHVMISTKGKGSIARDLIDESTQIKPEKSKKVSTDQGNEKKNNIAASLKIKNEDITDSTNRDDNKFSIQQNENQSDEGKKCKQLTEIGHVLAKPAKSSEKKKFFEEDFHKNESMEVHPHDHEDHKDHHEEEKIEIVTNQSQNHNRNLSGHQSTSDHQDKVHFDHLHDNKHERDHSDIEEKVLEAAHDDDIVEISRKSQVKIKDRKSIEEKKMLLINFASAWSVVKNLNLSTQRKMVAMQTEKAGGLFGKLFGSCSATKLPGVLASERDQILAYSKIPFQEDNELHFDILRTVFIKLTGNYNCPRFGSHWEIIGFQGKDPAMDLRGAGMLGLLQILAFVTSHFETLKEALSFSLKDKLNPPLCSSMLGVTLIVMELVREGKLNGQINSQRSAINAINNIYFAIYYKIYSTFKNENMKIGQYQILLRDVTEASKRHPHRILTEFLHGLESSRAFNR